MKLVKYTPLYLHSSLYLSSSILIFYSANQQHILFQSQCVQQISISFFLQSIQLIQYFFLPEYFLSTTCFHHLINLCLICGLKLQQSTLDNQTCLHPTENEIILSSAYMPASLDISKFVLGSHHICVCELILHNNSCSSEPLIGWVYSYWTQSRPPKWRNKIQFMKQVRDRP